MSKHTRGPWHVYDRGIGWEVHDGAECSDTCDTINSEFRETFTEADARLIAAAPELLEACHDVKNFLANLENGTRRDDPLFALRIMFHKPLHAVLDAAIAKAEGVDPANDPASSEHTSVEAKAKILGEI